MRLRTLKGFELVQPKRNQDIRTNGEEEGTRPDKILGSMEFGIEN